MITTFLWLFILLAIIVVNTIWALLCWLYYNVLNTTKNKPKKVNRSEDKNNSINNDNSKSYNNGWNVGYSYGWTDGYNKCMKDYKIKGVMNIDNRGIK